MSIFCRKRFHEAVPDFSASYICVSMEEGLTGYMLYA